MVRLRDAAITTLHMTTIRTPVCLIEGYWDSACLSIPPSLSITVDNSVWLGRDGNVCPADFDQVVVCFREAKGGRAGKRDGRASEQLREVKRLVAGNVDAVEGDGSACRCSSWHVGVYCDGARASDR